MKDQRLEWDSKNLKFTNNDEANELLKIDIPRGVDADGVMMPRLNAATGS